MNNHALKTVIFSTLLFYDTSEKIERKIITDEKIQRIPIIIVVITCNIIIFLLFGL